LLGRRYLGIELDAGYHAISRRRLDDGQTPASVPAARVIDDF
jgi:hypothetical protein